MPYFLSENDNRNQPDAKPDVRMEDLVSALEVHRASIVDLWAEVEALKKAQEGEK